MNYREVHSLFDRAKQKDISYIVTWLLPYGKKQGGEYVALNPTNRLGSFRINLTTGKWADFATGDRGGDIISLYAYLKGISNFEAAKEMLGELVDSFYLNQYFNYSSIPKNKLNKYIADILNDSTNAEYSIVKQYLNNRGIVIPIPSSILHHSNLYHSRRRYLPAMIAKINKYPEQDIVGLHRTYLSEAGLKAKVDPNKKIIGDIRGGGVYLKHFRKSYSIVLAEGIETALSYWQIYFESLTEAAIIACLSATGMFNISLPPAEQVSKIIIAADNDNAGLNIANKLSDKLLSQDYKVFIHNCNDFNDLLMKYNKVNKYE